MSIAALNWAFEQNVGSPSLKLVLIIMADYTNDKQNWECWPCAKTLAEMSCLNRKTIQRCLEKLRQLGVLIDTGKRCGTTGQVKVYRFNIEQAQKRAPLKTDVKRPRNDLKEAQLRATEPLEPSSSLRSEERETHNLFPDPPPAKEKKNGKTELPHNFVPDASARELAGKLSVDVDRTLAEFRDWCLSKRPRYADWQATFRNSLRRASGSRGNRQGGGNFGRRDPPSVVDAALRVAARHSGAG